jgi:cholesterol transport system auxiliary component
MTHRALALVAMALSLGLGGCITLFPKEPPVQLYRFEADAPPSGAATATPFRVRGSPIDFDGPAAGDQLMSTTGDEVAYLGGARWSAPASSLFEDAVEHGFAAGGPAQLIGPAAPGRDDYRLQLKVTRFEATYPSGAAAPPTVVVRLHAVLLHEKDLSPAGERLFEADIPAADNHMAAIVTAYDAATTKVVGDLVAWVGQGGG